VRFKLAANRSISANNCGYPGVCTYRPRQNLLGTCCYENEDLTMTAATTSPSCEFIRRFRHDKKLWSGQFSADGARIFIRDQSFTEDDCNRGYIWDVQTGDMLYGGAIAPRGCSANCDYYAPEATDGDPVHRIYKVGSSEPVLEFEGRAWFDASPQLVVLNREPHELDRGHILYKVRQLYNLLGGDIVCDLDFIPETQRILAFSHDGAHVLTGAFGAAEKANEVSLWSVREQKRIAHLAPSDRRSIKGHLDTIETALFLPGRNDRVLTITAPWVYTQGLDTMAAILWDVESAEPVAQILCGGDRTADPRLNACDIRHDYAFADDGTYFAALRADGYTGPNEYLMRVFEMQAGTEFAQFEIESPWRIAGAPNAPYVAAASHRSPLVRIFNVIAKEEVAHCAAPAFMSDTPAMDVSFAPASRDGQFVLTTHKGGDAVLWRMPHWV
jgi:WD40 repeat protein